MAAPPPAAASWSRRRFVALHQRHESFSTARASGVARLHRGGNRGAHLPGWWPPFQHGSTAVTFGTSRCCLARPADARAWDPRARPTAGQRCRRRPEGWGGLDLTPLATAASASASVFSGPRAAAVAAEAAWLAPQGPLDSIVDLGSLHPNLLLAKKVAPRGPLDPVVLAMRIAAPNTMTSFSETVKFLNMCICAFLDQYLMLWTQLIIMLFTMFVPAEIKSWNAAYESLLGSNKPFPADWPPSHSTRKLGGFLLYHFMKSWDDVRLSLINTLSTPLRMKFLVDILKSRTNECFDSFSEDLPVMFKDLGRM